MKNTFGCGKTKPLNKQRRNLTEKQKRKKKEKYRLKRKLNRDNFSDAVSNDQIQYFLRVEKSLDEFLGHFEKLTREHNKATQSNNLIKNPLESQDNSEEERKNFFRNVFEQLTISTIDLLQHNIVTKVVQKLICQLVKLDELEIFVKLILSSDGIVSQLFNHPFGSHVLESVISQYSNVLGKNQVDFDKLPHLHNFIQSIFAEQDKFFDTYSSHVISTVIELLGRIQMSSSLIKSRLSRNNFFSVIMNNKQKEPINESSEGSKFNQVLLNYFTVFNHKKNTFFEDNKVDIYLKKCFECIMKSLSNCSEINEIIIVPSLCLICSLYNQNKMIFNEFLEFLTGIFTFKFIFDDAISYLFQTMLVLTNIAWPDETKQPMKIIQLTDEMLISDNIIRIIEHVSANHVLQAYISTIGSKSKAELVLSKLIDHIQLMLNSSKFQLVVKLLELVQKFKLDEHTIVKSLIDSFNFPDDVKPTPQLILNFLTLTPINFLIPTSNNPSLTLNKANSIEYHGATIVKVLLNISDLFMDSFTKLIPEHIIAIAKDKYGTIIFKEFFSSKSISDDKKAELGRKIIKSKNLISSLCQDKIGSYCIEDLFNNLSIEMKKLIAEKIFKSRDIIVNNHFGMIVFKKLRIAQFESNLNRWVKIFS